MKCLLVALLLFGSGSNAAGAAQDPEFTIEVDVFATQPGDEDWLAIESGHYKVLGNADEEDLRRVAADLEIFRARFADWFPRAMDRSPVPTTVILFRNRDSMARFVPGIREAFVLPGETMHHIVLEDRSLSREIIRDVTRLLIPDSVIPVPFWFREGVADYFSTIQVNRYPMGDERWTRIGERVGEYHGLLRDDDTELFSFEELFAMTPASAELQDPELNGVFHAESWAVVHFLVSSGAIPAALQFSGERANGGAFQEAFERVFRTDPESFEEIFLEYVEDSRSDWPLSERGLTLNPNLEVGQVLGMGFDDEGEANPPRAIQFEFDSSLADIEEKSVRPVSFGEALVAMGELMLEMDNLDEAGRYFSGAVYRIPEFPRVHVALARLELLQGRFQEASDALDRALELDPESFLTHYYRAVLIDAERDAIEGRIDRERFNLIRFSLERTLELEPGFAPAAEMLSDFYFVEERDVNRAAQVLIDALAPGDESMLLRLARLLTVSGEAPTAFWLSNLLVGASTDAGTVQSAEALKARLGDPEGFPRLELMADATGAAPELEFSRSAFVPAQTYEGVIAWVDCVDDGLVVYMESNRRPPARLATAVPDEVIMVSSAGIGAGRDLCVMGPGAQPRARVTYRPSESGEVNGELLGIDILGN